MAHPSHPPASASAAPERRTNARLRELIDEMLVSVRVAVNRELWTPGEREAAEADLARLMADVRRAALVPARPAED